MSITVNGDVIIHFDNSTIEEDNNSSPITPILSNKQVQKLRSTTEMKTIKKQVRKRDIHCQCCGEMDKQLQVHHIMPLSDYPELNCDEGNLICLCQSCHNRYHNEYKDEGINAVTFSHFMKRYARRRF